MLISHDSFGISSRTDGFFSTSQTPGPLRVFAHITLHAHARARLHKTVVGSEACPLSLAMNGQARAWTGRDGDTHSRTIIRVHTVSHIHQGHNS